ncbi:EscR/YscR/HrcR family type III secretion system export apparatus protein [Burkholderia sp. SG-MS1]|uniref:EscR/YscR/HrcR family type III secretion system export apparatus protein n=1 Tax=Paraburkholderia sp. SG-MS1 TaxID=2023741 RepID=UPI0014484E54|nr:EscR/YscR/HrcR family type III secretion system export apparatus protein [Paraburkholderia sp. SG-MS1]NKJ45237.1 EscR/YscR/HrcR family type III secretion system export apparatus protein [Paraburkholderia sp. SG-MS1]
MRDQIVNLQLIVLFFFLGLLPLIVTMTTSFTKISIVLTLLRSAVGVQQAPGNMAISTLALAATLVVMAPTLEKIGADPAINERIVRGELPDVADLYRGVRGPLGDFMLEHSRPTERAFMVTAVKRLNPASDVQETDFSVLISAFMISEISSGFEAGFLLYMAFLIIDLVVANVLMAMGMVMLSPTTVSTPLKLLVLVSVSGISKLMHGLIVSYAK